MSTILELLKHQPTPVTAAQIAKLTGHSTKTMTAALDDLARSGRAYALTQGASTAYAAQPPLDLCADALRPLVAAQIEPQAPAKLASALPKALRPWFEEALARLIVQGDAWWLAKGKVKLVTNRAPRPSDFVSPAQQATVEAILTEANRHRRTGLKLSHFLSWLDTAEVLAKPKAKPEITPELLTEWYALDRATSSTAMVPIPQTFKHYETWAAANNIPADIVEFRQALESLYHAGQALLEPCERPQDLPDAERALQVPLTLGPPGYYWSLVA